MNIEFSLRVRRAFRPPTLEVAGRAGIILRPLRESDADALWVLVKSCRAYLARGLTWPKKWKSVRDASRFIKEALDKSEREEALHFVIWYEDRPVGMMSFRDLNMEERKAELGYWVAKKFQGRHIATDAARTLMAHGFQTLHLWRIEATCCRKNKGTVKIVENLGMAFESCGIRTALFGGKRVKLQLYYICRHFPEKESRSTNSSRPHGSFFYSSFNSKHTEFVQ